jgi:hypothetical protein
MVAGILLMVAGIPASAQKWKEKPADKPAEKPKDEKEAGNAGRKGRTDQAHGKSWRAGDQIHRNRGNDFVETGRRNAEMTCFMWPTPETM